MKNLLIILLLSCSFYSAAQGPNIKSIKGAFLNSIDWYIQSTNDSINTFPLNSQVKSLNQLGFIEVRMRNVDDSISEIISKQDTFNVTTVNHFKKLSFLITMSPTILESPCLYFVYKNIPIIIYTGFENYMALNEKDIRKFERDNFSRNDHVVVDHVPEYLVDLDDRYKNGFKWKVARRKNFWQIER